MPRRSDDIAALLQPLGLILRGGFALDPEIDADLLRSYPQARQLILIGNAGSAIWPPVARFVAANPTDQHPLDHWTTGTLTDLASQIGAVGLFPFGGPPWWPFQRWAQRAESVHPSPLAILIHPEFGLWHAYRAAFLLADPVDLPAVAAQASPCDSCADQPCLTTCPVGAFSLSGYDVERCAAHVNSAAGEACRQRGCLARLACPVGVFWQYESDHAAFHMAAFQRSHPTDELSEMVDPADAALAASR
jgi:ferredoxin-like protein FixX